MLHPPWSGSGPWVVVVCCACVLDELTCVSQLVLAKYKGFLMRGGFSIMVVGLVFCVCWQWLDTTQPFS